jgi:hypothetical protein
VYEALKLLVYEALKLLVYEALSVTDDMGITVSALRNAP